MAKIESVTEDKDGKLSISHRGVIVALSTSQNIIHKSYLNHCLLLLFLTATAPDYFKIFRLHYWNIHILIELFHCKTAGSLFISKASQLEVCKVELMTDKGAEQGLNIRKQS